MAEAAPEEASPSTAAPAAAAVENDATHQKLIALLTAKGIVFSKKEHAPVLTSQQAAEVRGSRLEQGAKAMLLRANGKFHLVVMSAARKLDLKKVKKVLNTKSLSMATEEEVRTVSGCLPGAVPPFGSLWGVHTLMDSSLRTEKEIEFNAGLRTRSVHMFQADYEAIEKPTVVDVVQE